MGSSGQGSWTASKGQRRRAEQNRKFKRAGQGRRAAGQGRDAWQSKAGQRGKQGSAVRDDSKSNQEQGMSSFATNSRSCKSVQIDMECFGILRLTSVSIQKMSLPFASFW